MMQAPPLNSAEDATRAAQASMERLLMIASGTMPDGRPAPAWARRLAVVGWFALREKYKADMPEVMVPLAHAAYGIDSHGNPHAEYPGEQAEARRMLIDGGWASPLDFDRLTFDQYRAHLLARLAALGFPGPGQIG